MVTPPTLQVNPPRGFEDLLPKLYTLCATGRISSPGRGSVQLQLQAGATRVTVSVLPALCTYPSIADTADRVQSAALRAWPHSPTPSLSRAAEPPPVPCLPPTGPVASTRLRIWSRHRCWATYIITEHEPQQASVASMARWDRRKRH